VLRNREGTLINITLFGPCLAIILPIKGNKTADTSMLIELADETSVLFQPNSVDIGMRYTLKVVIVPETISTDIKHDNTITHP
jgi:hypothetical protein